MERKIGRNEIAVFILNSDQELLLQKRSVNKKHYPNCWALCTGHVEPGESLSDAALREMKEELGIIVNLSKLHSFANGKFDIHEDEWQGTYFYYTFCNFNESDFILQTDELSEVRWVPIDWLIEQILKQDSTMVTLRNKISMLKYLKENILFCEIKN